MTQTILHENQGDCYVVATNLLMDNMDKATLVHGMVNGRGRLHGVRFGHAWVEMGNKVMDYSNGSRIEMPIKAYYDLGKVDPKECKYYTHDQAVSFMLKTEHYGPWEMSGDTIVTEDIPNDTREIGKRKKRIPRSILHFLPNNFNEATTPMKTFTQFVNEATSVDPDFLIMETFLREKFFGDKFAYMSQDEETAMLLAIYHYANANANSKSSKLYQAKNMVLHRGYPERLGRYLGYSIHKKRGTMVAKFVEALVDKFGGVLPQDTSG